MDNKLNFSWIIPGKLAGHAAPKAKVELAWLNSQGILALVRMAGLEEARVDSVQVASLGMWDLREPVPDFAAPSKDQIKRMIKFIGEALAADRPVGISCGAGLGRTGTVLACYLVSSQGYAAAAAISAVRKKRPGSIETKQQEQAVKDFASRVKK